MAEQDLHDTDVDAVLHQPGRIAEAQCVAPTSSVVASLASHLIVMRQGKVVEEGPAAELFKQPRSEYTRALFAAAFRNETTNGGAVAT